MHAAAITGARRSTHFPKLLKYENLSKRLVEPTVILCNEITNKIIEYIYYSCDQAKDISIKHIIHIMYMLTIIKACGCVAIIHEVSILLHNSNARTLFWI